MNYDKESKVVIGICVALLIVWAILAPRFSQPADKVPKPGTEQTTPEAVGATTETTAKTPSTKNNDVKPKTVAALPQVEKTTQVTADKQVKKLQDVLLQNDLTEVAISPNAGGIKFIKLKKYYASVKNRLVQASNIYMDKDLTPPALAVRSEDEWILTDINGKSNAGKSYVLNRRFKNNAGQQFTVTQSWTLADNYQLKYDLALENNSDAKLDIKDLSVFAGEMSETKHLSGDLPKKELHYVDLHLADKKTLKSFEAIEKETEKSVTSEREPVSWISVSNKYFACMLFGKEPFADGAGIKRGSKIDFGKKVDKKYLFVSAYGNIGRVALEPQKSRSWSYTYYTGPKSIALLEMADPNASKIMRLGWSWIEMICQFLLKALIYFEKLTGSWGMSIILLTVVVKTILWPLTHKANMSMRKMQKLQPLMQELREKYSDNQQMQSMKMMELYKEHKVNPIGGCLPILLQFPVFIALYFTLEGSVDIRQASFLWAHDLVQPDTVATIMGLPINPLVIVWSLLLVGQQLMTPSAMDPMQQKMMMAMPVVMLVFLYNLPAGLTLYWTVSQIISLVQLFINKQLYKDDKPQAQKPAKA